MPYNVNLSKEGANSKQEYLRGTTPNTTAAGLTTDPERLILEISTQTTARLLSSKKKASYKRNETNKPYLLLK